MEHEITMESSSNLGHKTFKQMSLSGYAQAPMLLSASEGLKMTGKMSKQLYLEKAALQPLEKAKKLKERHHNVPI